MLECVGPVGRPLLLLDQFLFRVHHSLQPTPITRCSDSCGTGPVEEGAAEMPPDSLAQ